MQINPTSSGSVPPEYTMAHSANSVDNIVNGQGEERVEPEKKAAQIVVEKKVNVEISESGSIDILA